MLHRSDAATTMLHRGDGIGFPLDVKLGVQDQVFNLGFIRPENLVSHGLGLYVPFGKLLACCHVPLLRSGFYLATQP